MTTSHGRPSAFDVHEAPTLRSSRARLSVADPLVLVVDDDLDACTIYCGSLYHLGFRTILRKDGMQAIDAAHRQRPDAVLMDISMPRLDGLAATRRIKAAAAPCPPLVVLMTAFGDDRYAAAIDAGADALLCKPFNPMVLAEILAPVRGADDGTIVKRCACGHEYTRRGWNALPLCGTIHGVELRNCIGCHSSLAVAPCSTRGASKSRARRR